MSFESPFMDMRVNLVTAAFVAIYSLVKVNAPDVEQPEVTIIQEEVQGLKEKVQVQQETEEPVEETFEEKHSDEPYIYLIHSIDVKLREDWSYLTTIHKKRKN